MALIGDNQVRMANICAYTANSINGVSKLHSEIIKDSVFHDYYLFKPQAFKNVTNGIAYRRWLLASNPELCKLLDETIGDGYKHDASDLSKLNKFENDKTVLKRLNEIKLENKTSFANYLAKSTGQVIDPNSIFDCQVKRMHEYKRQHLNALNIAAQYLYLKENPNADFIPKTYIFGAKAAPGYYMAKQMIRMICKLGDLINNDPAVRDKLRVVYLEEYCVSLSEHLMPAAEVSEQISLAGTEASGTGNMKFMLNGAITLGTLDGANVEIADAAGKENELIFGMLTPEVNNLKQVGYHPNAFITGDDVANCRSELPGARLERRELPRSDREPAQQRPVYGHGRLQGLPPCTGRPAEAVCRPREVGTHEPEEHCQQRHLQRRPLCAGLRTRHLVRFPGAHGQVIFP